MGMSGWRFGRSNMFIHSFRLSTRVMTFSRVSDWWIFKVSPLDPLWYSPPRVTASAEYVSYVFMVNNRDHLLCTTISWDNIGWYIWITSKLKSSGGLGSNPCITTVHPFDSASWIFNVRPTRACAFLAPYVSFTTIGWTGLYIWSCVWHAHDSFFMASKSLCSISVSTCQNLLGLEHTALLNHGA